MSHINNSYWKGFPYRASAILSRTTRDILTSRGFIFAMICILIPSYISLYTLLDPQGGMKEWWGMFSWFGLALYLQLLVLIFSLIYGSSMVNEDIDNRTMTYLIVRGSRRAEIYLCKYFGTILAMIIMFTISIVTTYLLLAGHGSVEDLMNRSDVLLSLLLTTYVGIMIFTALFSLIGAAFKKPLMIGLIYGFFWEIIIVNINLNVGHMTIMAYLRSMFTGNNTVSSVLDLENTVDPTFSWIFLLILSGFFVAIGCFFLHRKDIN